MPSEGITPPDSDSELLLSLKDILDKTYSECLTSLDLSPCANYGDLGMAICEVLSSCKYDFKAVRSLNISGFELRSIATEFFDIVRQKFNSLEVLGLARCSLGTEGAIALARSGSWLSSLTEFNLELNCLGPSGVDALLKNLIAANRLESLNLASNEIGRGGARAISRAIGSFGSLRALDLRNNSMGPKGIEQFAALKPESSSLHHLDLTSNGLGESGSCALARALTGIRQLRSLQLSGNAIGAIGIGALAASTECLSHLEQLVLRDNLIGNQGVTVLSGVLNGLAKLRVLDLENNRISSTGIRALAKTAGNLGFLLELNLSNNKIGSGGLQSLCECSKQLKSLQALYVKNCDITDVGLARLLSALVIPPWKTSLQRIDLVNNPIGSAFAELLTCQEAATWRNYRLLGQRDGTESLLEAKLLILGEGRRGKTHLRRRVFEQNIKYYNASEDSTHDVDIVPWQLVGGINGQTPPITVRVWDFGGQPHLHASHRFFLSDKRGMFLIVCDATQTREENRLDYWLRLVRHEASEHSPVIVVITKCDLVDCETKRQVERRLERLNSYELWLSGGFGKGTDVSVLEGSGWSEKLGGAAEVAKHWARHASAIHSLEALIKRVIQFVPDLSSQYPPALITQTEHFC